MKFTFAASLILALNVVNIGAFAPSFKPAASKPSTTARDGFISNRIIDFVVEKKLIDKQDFSRETKDFLKKLKCSITQFTMVAGGPKFVEQIKDSFVGDNTRLNTCNLSLGWERKGPNDWTKVEVGEDDLEVSPSWTTSLLERDDLSKNEKGGLKDDALAKILTTNVFAQLDDSDFAFENNEQVTRVMTELKLVPGMAFPVTYNTDFNLQTDESFSRMFFHGIGAPLMAKEPASSNTEHGPYVIDLEFMKGLDYRSDKFKKYGARIHFDDNQIVSAIHDFDTDEFVLRGEPGWQAAKMQAKVSAFTLLTVREHLAQTHLIMSNSASREIVKNLHLKHPIRRLLAIFTYNAVSVNQNASQQLVPERCLIHRATPLTFKGMQQVFENAYVNSISYQPFPDREIKNPAVAALEKEGGFPYVTEGCEYYEIIRNFVREWLGKAGEEASDDYALAFYEAMKKTSEGQVYELPEYSAENMVDMISSVIFAVTGYHELIGHAPDYTDFPDKAGFRIAKRDPLQCDAQSYMIAAVITSSTSLPAPQLVAEFPNYIGVDAPEWEREVWTTLQSKLKAQGEVVRERDAKRDFEFKYMDPDRFECSVSV